MSIRDWPESERPRERLFQHGPDVLTDTELLAILLISGSPKNGLTAMDCARMLLTRYSNLRNIAKISSTELFGIPGIGPGKASRILSAFEMAKRTAAQKKERGMVFSNSQDVFEAYSMRLRDEKQEIFTVMMLDSKNRFLREERISLGTLNHSIVHPREVFKSAIRESAASVILVHNHPSGDSSPSGEDIRLTDRLVAGGKLLGIQVLDHLIIGEAKYYSFCDQGRLKRCDANSSSRK